MELKIAVCDDEHEQTEYTRMLVSRWAGENNITAAVEMFDSAESFKAAWSESQAFDILLLDIEMGGQNGVELAREIRRSDAKLAIIFITGFVDYMPEGYDVSALHYLIKPIKEAKLFEVLDKAVKNLSKDTEFLALNINRKDIFVPLHDIMYIEASLNYVIINTVTEQYKVKMSLTEIEDKLGGGFFKCTRSFVVGLRYIHTITKKEIILTNGDSVPLARGLYQALNDAFIKYF